MKTIKLIFLLIISIKSFGQDSLWKKTIFNEMLTLNLPAGAAYAVSDYVKAYGGGLGSNYYGFQFYDSVFIPIENEKTFQTSLTGFIEGRIADPTLKNYHALVTDTSLHSIKGLMATYTTTNTTEAYKRIYYFVTMANSKFYGFYVYSPFASNNDEEINFFFKSIVFNTEQLKEKSFKLTPVRLTKKADK